MKKKICFVVSSTGTLNFLKKHMEYLSKEYSIFVVSDFKVKYGKTLTDSESIIHKKIPIERSINIVKDIVAVYKLYRFFNKMKFDAVHSVTPKAGLIAALAGKLSGIKNRFHIFTGQVWATKNGIFRVVLKNIDRAIARLTTKVLVDGQSQKDFLVNENVLKEHKAIVLGKGSISGVDINRFYPDENKVLELRKSQPFVPTDKLIFLFVGRLNADKGITELAIAYEKLRRKNENIFLLLVGTDEENYKEKLKTLITDETTYLFVNGTSEPETFYRMSDVFCFPSHREGFGTSVIEASATGLPIICSDAYGLLDTIVDDVTGLRHTVGSSDDIYAKMEHLANNQVLRKKLGENGLSYVKENFRADTISGLWFKFYTKYV